MATLSSNNPTLLDHAKALDPDGSIAVVVEILHETNEMLADMSFFEGNLPTGHRHTIRTGLPAPTWRKLYGGVQPTKSTREQVTDTCGMLEDYAEVDKAEADLNGNTNEFRLSEARAHIEGMSQELQQTVIYGDEAVNPERFTGLEARYNSRSAANKENIIDAGGTGSDNRSIWLIVWGKETCHGILPKGSTAGIQVNDKGQVTIENADGSNGRMEAYRMHFRLDAGLTVRDWRYVVRICNIDASLLTADISTGANLPELMFEATEMIPSMGLGRAAFYMDRATRTKFRQQLAHETKQSTLSYENVGGVMSPMFNEIPVRRCDKLAVDEARVT
jgi:hypothetical protein